MVNAQDILNQQDYEQKLKFAKKNEALRTQALKLSREGRQKLAFQKAAESARLKYAKQGPAILRGKERVKISKVVSGLAGALLGNDVMTGNVGGSGSGYSQGSPGRGRGRPTQTFTPKMLPDGRVVRMPVQAFKRASSMIKAQQRMQAELAKAKFSMQPSPNEMPQGYGQYSAEDAFAGQDGPSAVQQLQMRQFQQQMAQQAQMQANPAQSPSMMQRVFGQPQQQPMQFSPRPPMAPGNGPTQRLQIWGGFREDPSKNILNAPNIFNRQGETTIGVRRQQY